MEYSIASSFSWRFEFQFVNGFSQNCDLAKALLLKKTVPPAKAGGNSLKIINPTSFKNLSGFDVYFDGYI
ncbi:hypothetical protein ACWA1F_21425 [Flavobacterium sp. 3-218]